MRKILTIWGKVLQGIRGFLNETVFYSFNVICGASDRNFLKSTRAIRLTWNFRNKEFICQYISFWNIYHKKHRCIKSPVKRLRWIVSQKYCTTESCYLFSKNVSSQICDRVLNMRILHMQEIWGRACSRQRKPTLCIIDDYLLWIIKGYR